MKKYFIGFKSVDMEDMKNAIKAGIAIGLFVGVTSFTSNALYDIGHYLNKKIREKLYSGDSKDKPDHKADLNESEDEILDNDIFEEEDK